MGFDNLHIGIGSATRIAAAAVLSLGLASCGKVSNKYGVSASPRLVAAGEEVPKGGGVYRVGKPYVIAGQTYTPKEDASYSAQGLASWYGEDFHGRRTANGEIYDMNAISAAHPTLPIPSYARVTNLNNNRSIVVRVNDRGPFHPGRVIDVSVRTAKLLGFYDLGTTRVKVDYVARASLDGSDDTKLLATLRHGDKPAPGAEAPVMVASNSPAARSQRPDPNARTAALAAVPSPQAQPALRRTNPGFEVAARRQPSPPLAQSPGYHLASSRPASATRGIAVDQPASFDSRFGPTMAAPAGPSAAPVSAFAPGSTAPSGVITGRGLY